MWSFKIHGTLLLKILQWLLIALRIKSKLHTSLYMLWSLPLSLQSYCYLSLLLIGFALTTLGCSKFQENTHLFPLLKLCICFSLCLELSALWLSCWAGCFLSRLNPNIIFSERPSGNQSKELPQFLGFIHCFILCIAVIITWIYLTCILNFSPLFGTVTVLYFYHSISHPKKNNWNILGVYPGRVGIHGREKDKETEIVYVQYDTDMLDI